MNYPAKYFGKRNPSRDLLTKYSRARQWVFEGGSELLPSSSPQLFHYPMSEHSAFNPEEAFIASVSETTLP